MTNLTPSPRGRVAGSFLPAGLLLHPYQVACALFGVIVAASLGLSTLSDDINRLTLVQRVMPFGLAFAWAAYLGLGGVACLVGVFTRSARRWSVPLELFGLALSGSAWAIYAVVVYLSTEQNAIVPVGTGLVLTLAAAARAYALVLATRIVGREGRTPTPPE